MNEPPRSRPFRRWKTLPALVIWGFMCLRGAAESESEYGIPDAEGSTEAHFKTHITRRHHEREHHSKSEHPRLKPRPVRAKIPPVSPPGRAHRLIVKFADALEARAGDDGSLTVNDDEAGKTPALEAVVDSLQLQFRTLQSAPEESLNALRKRAELRSGQQQADAAGLLEVVTRNSSPRTVLAASKALLPLSEVEYVEIESIDAPPPPPSYDVSPTTPSLVSYQTYRGTSEGIGVDYVWDTIGTKGHPDLRITDCEYMFNSRHEDLEGLVSIQPHVSSMYSSWGDNHGTAAIGILAAGDNGYGMNGAVPDCQMHFYPEYATMEWGYTQSRASTITAAIAASAPGDIVMLEMQSTGPNGKYGPAEYQSSVWDAVKTGTDAGVIIIAAAGNDHENLDGSAWAEYRSRGDSGAIIVGAGDTSRSRQWFSTYGSRVDLQGWGGGVATTGYGSLATYGDDPDQEYTTSFNGTSSATPIVASAAALLQSVAIEKLGTRLEPAEMRSLLVSSGRPQTGDTSKPIGPLPDLTAAVPQLLAAEFSSSSPIIIPDSGQASPFPSTIPVSGVDGIVSSVRVRINGLTHSGPWNLDILLVSPSGQVAALMSDAGGSYNLANTSLMFDDAAPTAIPESTTIVSGRYRPANYGYPMETPPSGTVGGIGTHLNALAADGANGDWKLYVMDDHAGDTGSIASWSVSFETIPYPGVAFTESSRQTSENCAPVTLTATLTEATTVDVSIPLSVSGSASENDDFTLDNSTILIPAGQTSGCATLTVNDDSLDEDDESVVVTMGTPVHANAGAVTSETITILDNDLTFNVTSEFGNPMPGTGAEVITQATEVTASVTSPEEQGETRHVCTGWTGTGSVPVEGSATTTTFAIEQNSSVTWKWDTQYRINVCSADGGTVDKQSDWHPQGSEVTLTATPDNGHHFAGWTIHSGTISSGSASDPQITVQLDGPASVSASFLPNLTPREAYETWASAIDPPPPPTSHPLGDGVPMLLKYAFNMNASGSDVRTLVPDTGTAGLPCLTRDDTKNPPVFRLQYLRQRNSGPNYVPLQMTDPGSGTRAPMAGTRTFENIDTEWQRVTIEQAIDPLSPRLFFTVEVTLPDDPP